MPPQITFIRLSKDTSIPIKIFIKPSSSNQNKSSLAINSKSLITLNNTSPKYFQTRLSNNYLDNLINKLIRADLLNVLFDMCLEDIFSSVSTNKHIHIKANSTTIILIHDDDKLKYTLVVPFQLVLLLRRAFRRLTQADVVWLENHNISLIDKNIRADSDINLLVKSVSFNENSPSVPIQQDENDVMFVPDDEASEESMKKNLGYKISKVGIFNNLTYCVKIYLES
jgi:Single strand annealing-weakened 1.